MAKEQHGDIESPDTHDVASEASEVASDEEVRKGSAPSSSADPDVERGNGQTPAMNDQAGVPTEAGMTDPGETAADGAEAESGEPSDGAPVDAEEDEQAKLSEEVRRYKDRWVRLAAEFDNYKKRTGREFTALVKNAGESLITELLPIMDNMERALQAPQTSEETRSFAQGFEMIRQQFLERLEKAGMKEIVAEGETFDPTRHEAVMAVESGDHPADTVINVVEKGYTLNEKVLRAAKVIVTRASAKAPDHPKAPDQADQAETENQDGD